MVTNVLILMHINWVNTTRSDLSRDNTEDALEILIACNGLIYGKKREHALAATIQKNVCAYVDFNTWA